ncbi:MAG: glycerate kinase [Ilumatobacter sp.]|nr:glycerate kinase [bacterium]MDG1266914.1 glycerate kinase [Ilumatobacter sp.]
MRVLAAPDKFKGSATAREVAAAIGHACWELGVDCVEIPMADGGDGLLEVLGGANRESTVTGPLGDPVRAGWRFSSETAVIEMARASGLVLAGGAVGNKALDATTTGTGELIDHALDAGARRIIVGLGGSATTDGGFGAIRAITAIARLKQVELLVACDVSTRFADAAAVFGSQKGASVAQIKLLERRLGRLVQMFDEDFAFDVTDIEGGGAAGGLGGALAALGGRLVPGFELVADELDLFDHLDVDNPHRVDVIITGEGRLDSTSFDGKVVGGIVELGRDAGIPVVAVVGDADADVTGQSTGLRATAVLADLFGLESALAEPKQNIERATAALIRAHLD